MKKVEIPHISNEELIRRYLSIKPVVEVYDVKYWLRTYSIPELRSVPYFLNAFIDKDKTVGNALYNHTYCYIKCRHSYGHHGLFSPTVAEILAEIPEEILNSYTIDAFELCYTEQDLNAYRKALQQGFHTSVVKLYIRVVH